MVHENLYELGELPFDDLEGIQSSFNNLPADKYCEEGLRSRRYSCYHYNDGKLEQLQTEHFMQSYEVNKFAGDVERVYEPIEILLNTNPVFLKMFDIMLRRTQITEDSVMEVHQIRWHCNETSKEPAPEGNHQDGFDYLGVFMMNNHNVLGGDIMLFDAPDSEPFFQQRLENGEYLLINDKKLFHNGSKLIPTDNDDEGYWDVFVITATKRLPK